MTPVTCASRRLVFIMALWSVASARAAEVTKASRPVFMPTLAVETETHQERLHLDVGETNSTEFASVWGIRFAAGLTYEIIDWFPQGHIRGHTSLGIGVTLSQGHWPLHLRQEAVLSHAVAPWLSLEGGVGTGLQLDLTNLRRSYWEVGVHLGCLLAKVVELAIYPMLTLGLSTESTPVFEGTASHSIATAITPLNLMVRVHFSGLRF